MNNVRAAYGGESMHDFLSIVKLLLFVASAFLYFVNYMGNWVGTLNDIGKVFTIFMCIFLFCYAIWTVFLMKNKKSGFMFMHRKIIQAVDSFVFMVFLTVFIWLSSVEFSEYKFLFLFIIVISTLQSGMKYGICLSLISSSILFLTDYAYMLEYNFPVNFQNDIVTCTIYVAIAWIIGYYVKIGDKYLDSLNSLIDSGKQYHSEMNDILLKYRQEIKQLEIDMKKNIELVSSISHDLKTPLNVIFSALQMLYQCKDCEKKKNIDKHSKYVNVMKQNCYRLMKMINALLDVTKINSGTLKLDIHNINLVSAVEDIVDSVVPYAEGKNIDMVFDTDVEEKIMAVDIDKMDRIILNLLSNSMKFTKCGGKIAVNFRSMGNYVLISVEDNGIGIPEDRLETIFQKFSQVESIYRGICEGSGIGLYLVKSFIELHGGEINVESIYGSGSKFIVKLPVNTVKEDHSDISIHDYGLNRDKVSMEFSDITL